MNKSLTVNPSITLWKNELEMVLTNKRSLELRKLGSAGTYIENTFIHSQDKLYSIKCFKEAFNELILNEIQKNNSEKLYIEFITSVIDKFKNDIDLNTSSTFYLNKITELILKTININENIFQYEESFFTYCVYLNFTIHKDKSPFILGSIITKHILEILNSIIGLSDRITSFALFIIFSLDEPSPIDFQEINIEIGTNILRYSLSKKNITTSILNNFILFFAIHYPEIFKKELLRFNCKLNSECNCLIFKEDLSRRNFIESGDFMEWEKLIEIFYHSVNSNELIGNCLNREII